MNALKLTIIEFCNAENIESDAEITKEELFFTDDEICTAHKKCSHYLSGKSFNPYLGWNNQVYPKIKVKKVYFR